MADVTIADTALDIAPPWLADDGQGEAPNAGVGGKLLFDIGIALDGFLENLNQGLRARMPGVGTPTALAYIGADRVIDRGFQETDAAYAARLVIAFDTWRGAGTPQTLLRQIRAYVSPAAPLVRTVSNTSVWDTVDTGGTWSRLYASSNWDWDGFYTGAPSPAWWRAWVFLDMSGGMPWTSEGTWGDGQLWGDGGTWGSTATVGQVQAVRSIVAQWKPAGISVVNVILNFDSTLFDPTQSFGSSKLPDANFGQWAKVVSGTSEPSRFASAAYWDGVS